jgi:hypothetical protein
LQEPVKLKLPLEILGMALLEPEFEDPLDVILVFSCFYEIFVGSLDLLNRCSGDFFDTSLL